MDCRLHKVDVYQIIMPNNTSQKAQLKLSVKFNIITNWPILHKLYIRNYNWLSSLLFIYYLRWIDWFWKLIDLLKIEFFVLILYFSLYFVFVFHKSESMYISYCISSCHVLIYEWDVTRECSLYMRGSYTRYKNECEL